MKSLAELAAIRAKMIDQVNLRKDDNVDTRIVVGMATCGIAAGRLRRHLEQRKPQTHLTRLARGGKGIAHCLRHFGAHAAAVIRKTKRDGIGGVIHRDIDLNQTCSGRN